MNGDNQELKIAACFTIKNLLFKNVKEIRDAVMKELPEQKLLDLLDDDNVKIQE
jgi:hypothetical protein